MKKTPNINPESQDVAELQAMVKELLALQKHSESQWKQERQSLLEQLKLAFDRQFAKRSEALKPYDESQGDLFNEVECEAAKEEEVEVTTTTTTTTKKRGKRKPLPKTLPREVIELDLDDHEKQCACCQHSLHKIGEERSEKLEFSPAVLKVLEYVRPKYACRQCEQTEDNNHIVQKPAPQSIIPKSFATESLLANIILGKYQYAMPLYRQESLFTQSGIELSRTTMARWVIQVSEKFKPLYAALKSTYFNKWWSRRMKRRSMFSRKKNSVTCGSTARAQTRPMPPPNVKNIALYDYQNSRARACPVAS